MTHHHHEPGDVHPAGRITPSLLRMSASTRVAIAAAAAIVLWAAVWWSVG
jgi:hypothetical protein